jgi:restriction system protein
MKKLLLNVGWKVKELKCPEEERNETMEDGRNIIFYRLQWAKTYLKKAGLIDYSKRAHFNLSNVGKDLDLRKVEKIDKKYLSRFDSLVVYQKVC